MKDFKGKCSHHMGSTSIKGMMGKPMPDFTIVTEGLLPDIPNDVLKRLQTEGWEYCGVAPHSFNKNADHMFSY